MDVVLIGPPRVGKTTVGRLLARRLDVEHHEFDGLRRGYFEQQGFDMELNLRLFDEQGWGTMFAYWQVFQPGAIERFLAEHSGVMCLGGGAPIADYPSTVRRVDAAFAPFAHVVLLRPDADIERSMEILATRTDDDPAQREGQRYFLEHGTFERIVTHTVCTALRSPEDVVAQVLALLDAER